MAKIYKSEAMAAIHEGMEPLYKVGAIDKQTMREFDEACLMPVHPLTPEEIRAIREKENVSQTVFSHYLNVTAGLISQWERGEKKPSGSSLKLLLIVSKKGLSAIA
ncbi:MAG: putative DNA-binding protein [Alphaproteobacteria bacterium]|jgi:putative transcriptional regulator|nr:putative DNA-binding protein [Alphaproteobacteria bacterium]MDF3034257.1 putative DNA-binding protein [Alphaproteobacteria bacterium]